MAICLWRILKKSGSVIFITQRNRQTICLSHKSPNIFFPLLNEDSGACKGNANLPAVFTEILTTTNWSNSLNRNKCLSYSKSDSLTMNEILCCAKECKAYMEDDRKAPENPGRPDPEQVLHILDVLKADLPNIFKAHLNYKIYHPQIVFENNIRGTKTIGLSGYMKQMVMLRTIGHIKFAYLKMDILKITAHPEDGTVRVRWRIRGVPNFKLIKAFFKNPTGLMTKESEGWYDGFSIFYVRADGLIHKHIVDKMMPDSDEKVSNFQNNLAAKIALALGISIKDFSASPSNLLGEILELIEKDMPDICYEFKTFGSINDEISPHKTYFAQK